MEDEPTRVFKPAEYGGSVDEEEDEAFVEPFSLLENLVRERFRSPATVEPFQSVEVIHYQGRELVDVMRADPGQAVRVGPDRFQLLRMVRGGEATLWFRPAFGGTLVTGGRARSLSGLCVDRFLCRQDDPGLFALSLQPGDCAQVLCGGDGYLVRFVRAPVQPRARRVWRPSWWQAQILCGSAALHLCALLLLGFVGGEPPIPIATGEHEIFARPGSYRLPALEQPSPEPPRVQQPKPAPRVKTTTGSRVGQARAAGPKRAGSSAPRHQARQVLQALENLRPGGMTPGRSDLGALASNISAVRAPAGQVGFRIAGVIDRVGGPVRLAGGAGGGRDTRSLGQLLGGTGHQTGTLTGVEGVGYRGPRGRVDRIPTRKISCPGMDRSLIQSVVNKHMHELQRCYEVQLLSQPNLEGKIVVDWTIAPSGSVAEARLASSTLRSPAVASCVLARIRTWRFPPPGQRVKVRYPFVFRVRGF